MQVTRAVLGPSHICSWGDNGFQRDSVCIEDAELVSARLSGQPSSQAVQSLKSFHFYSFSFAVKLFFFFLKKKKKKKREEEEKNI